MTYNLHEIWNFDYFLFSKSEFYYLDSQLHWKYLEFHPFFFRNILLYLQRDHLSDRAITSLLKMKFMTKNQLLININ